MEKNYDIKQEPKINSLEDKLEKPNEKYIKPKFPRKQQTRKYPKYIDREFVLQAIANGEDPITGAKVNTRYLLDLLHQGVYGYYDTLRHTKTVPNPIGCPPELLYDTYLHEMTHALGFRTESITESYSQDVLKRKAA